MGGKGGDADKGFLDFSKFLIQQDEYIDYGKKAAGKIVNALKESSTAGIERISSAGHVGKDLANIVFTDHDLIIFVNDEDPQFEDILDDFEQVLTDFVEASSEKEPVEVSRKSKSSIGINYNGYKINLLVAANFIPSDGNKKPLTPLQIAQQAHATLQKIEKDSSQSQIYSPSLCDSHFEFMSKQSAFVLSLVRLCKFWNKSLLIPEHLHGRSTLIELIAVSVGQKEEKNSKKVQQTELILKSFQKFLELIVNFHDLNIEFKDFDALKALKTKGVNWKPNPSSFDPNFKSAPFVIEPTNPYNNLAKDVSESVIQLFKLYATETLGRLASQKDPKNIVMDVIFKPQPSIVPFKGNKTLQDFLKKADFIFDVEADGPPSKGDDDDDDMESEEESEDEFDEGDEGDDEEFPFCPIMEIHKASKKYTLADTKDILGYIQTLFSVVAQSFAYSYTARHKAPLDVEKVRKNLKKRIIQCVQLNVKGTGGVEDLEDYEGDSESDEDDDVDHEEYEVSIDMPAKVPGVKLNVAVSFREP